MSDETQEPKEEQAQASERAVEESSTPEPPAEHAHAGGGHDDHGHEEELGFLRKWVFSVDHKVIGVQYAVTALVFLAFGFTLMMMMRFQLAYPEASWAENPPPGWLKAIFAFLGGLFGQELMVEGRMDPGFYNSLGAMHGTIMVFLGVVPLSVGGFGNYVLPLQIGAPDMAFPKLNMMSYWVFFIGGIVMLASFFLDGGAANSGWTAYPPLSITGHGAHSKGFWDAIFTGESFWLIGMVFLITSSLLGSVNFIVTTIQMRAKGLTMWRLPIFVWAQLITSFLLLLAFPPLEAAGVLQLMDRVAHTSFFMPSGLVISEVLVSGVGAEYSGGGNPILWQHLFWFLAHPEVYVLILPGMGICCEVIANNTRKPLWGHRSIIYSLLALGFLSFIVWAHHMFMTGMGTTISAFFQTTTMIISIPSVIILTCLILSLYGAAMRFNTPMLFALAFLPMFAIGGLTGLPLGLGTSDIHLHDTYYVIGHFHYVVAPGSIFALFAGVYYWYPKVTGRHLSEMLGKAHFWISLVAMNGIFMPMLFAGMAGMLRRGFDPTIYEFNEPVIGLVKMTSWSAWLLGVGQIPFIINFFVSIFAGKKVESDNPWQATTLEWATPTPPPHGNFTTVPVVYRGPYEYSVPGQEADFSPQFLEEETT